MVSQASLEAGDEHFQEAPVFSVTAILARHHVYHHLAAEVLLQLGNSSGEETKAGGVALRQETVQVWLTVPATALRLLLPVVGEQTEPSPLSSPSACAAPTPQRGPAAAGNTRVRELLGLALGSVSAQGHKLKETTPSNLPL